MRAVSVRLGDVAKFVRGITFKPTDVLTEECIDALGCMRTKNVQEILDERDVWRLPKNFISNQNQLLQEGDLLVSTANSWNLVGKACWVPKLEYACTFGGFISALRGNEDMIKRRYLYHWFTSKHVQETLRSFGNKTTNISNLNLKRASDLQIPLPPLAEQQRIAALLDTADRILKLRESSIVKLDELEKRVFVEMFGDALAGTGKYKSLSFESITTRITYGFTSPMRHLESGIPILTAKNIKNGYIDLDNIHFADRKQFDDLSEKSKPRKGDVLITKDGTIGRTALVDSDETYCINQSVALVQLKNDLVTPQYTVGYLTADSTQRAMKNMSKGNALKHLQITELAKFPIPLPPMDYQNKYSSFVKEIKLKKQKINKSLVIANALIASLQHQAFTTGFNA